MLETTIKLIYPASSDKKVMQQVRIFIALLTERNLKVTNKIQTTGKIRNNP